MAPQEHQRLHGTDWRPHRHGEGRKQHLGRDICRRIPRNAKGLLLRSVTYSRRKFSPLGLNVEHRSKIIPTRNCFVFSVHSTAQCEGRGLHGQPGPRHKRITILYHILETAPPGYEVHCHWQVSGEHRKLESLPCSALLEEDR